MDPGLSTPYSSLVSDSGVLQWEIQVYRWASQLQMHHADGQTDILWHPQTSWPNKQKKALFVGQKPQDPCVRINERATWQQKHGDGPLPPSLR